METGNSCQTSHGTHKSNVHQQPNLGSPNHEDAAGLPTGTDPMDTLQSSPGSNLIHLYLELRLFDVWKKVPLKQNMIPNVFFFNGDDLPW